MQNDENCEQDEYCSVINPKGYPSITFHYSKNVTIENQRKEIYANTQISIYELKTNENAVMVKAEHPGLKQTIDIVISQRKGVSIWGLICANAKQFYESLQTIINAFHY